jgi:hypothetical protein
MGTKEKKQKLAQFFELLTFNGYSITEYMGKPLSYFDFDKIEITIEHLINEQNEQYN